MTEEPLVLIVDDDIDLAEITCEMMAAEGAAAIYRTTIADAMDALTRHAGSIRAMVTDINMQSPMSGIELAVFVAQEWPNVAICVTSGVMPERPRRLPDSASFLIKPWQTAELVQFLRASACLTGASGVTRD